MSVLASRCTSQTLPSPEQGLHTSHLPHSLYLADCHHQTTQPFLPSLDSTKHVPTSAAVPTMNLLNGTHPYPYQQPFHLSNLSGVHINSSYSSVPPSNSTTVLPPPRSYYVVSWVPRALPEVVQLIKEIPSEEERCLINRHFELGMLVMRRCGVQNPEEIKCLLDGFREGTTRLSLKDSSSKTTVTDDVRNSASTLLSSNVNNGYSNICCTPTVERRRLLIFFNDHRASRPWVLCPAKHCIKSARTTGKVKGRVKILQYDQQSTSVKIPKLFMDCLSDFLTRDHYVFATFCPQQKYTDHELDWFGVSDRSNEMNDKYGGDTIFRELLEEHDTKGSHRVWPFEDYIIFSNSQAKILAVFKKKQPLVTLYRNQLTSLDDCLSTSTTASSNVMGPFIPSASPSGSLPWHTSTIGSLSQNGSSNKLLNTSLASESCLQKAVKHSSYKCTSMESKYSSVTVSNNDMATAKGILDVKRQENDTEGHQLKASPKHDVTQALSRSPSGHSSTPSRRRKKDERRRRKKRRRYHNKANSPMDLTPSEDCDYQYNMTDHDFSSLTQNCEAPLLFNPFMSSTISSSTSFSYDMSHRPNMDRRNSELGLCNHSVGNDQDYMSSNEKNLFCSNIPPYFDEKKVSTQESSCGSVSAEVVMYGKNNVSHMDNLGEPSTPHLSNVGQPRFNVVPQNNPCFEGSSEMGLGQTAGFQSSVTSTPSTISSVLSSEVVQQAEEAEMVLIKVMTSVLAHLEPVEDTGTMDLNVAYHSVPSTPSGVELHSSMTNNSLTQGCSSISKMDLNDCSSHRAEMKAANYSTSFLVENSDASLKYGSQLDLISRQIPYCTGHNSPENSMGCLGSGGTSLTSGLAYNTKPHPSTCQGDGNQVVQDNEKNKHSNPSLMVSMVENYSFNNCITTDADILGKTKDTSCQDAVDCLRSNLDTSPMMPSTTSTTTNSSMTSGTDTNVDEISSGNWLASSSTDENHTKECEAKCDTSYGQGQGHIRVKTDVSYSSVSEKDAKQRRKVMTTPPDSSAVLYHDLVRQFLSRVAFGLDHPPMPQKRIPDTVKRVVTKIITDTIRDINLALLSSSFRWCSDIPSLQMPNYMLCKNTTAIRSTGNISPCFSGRNNVVGAANPMLPHTVETARAPTNNAASPWMMTCWQNNNQDAHITLPRDAGYCGEANFDCGESSMYRVTGFNASRSKGQVCKSPSLVEETVQNPFQVAANTKASGYPGYLDNNLLFPQLPLPYYVHKTGETVIDSSATNEINRFPLTVLPSEMTSDVKTSMLSDFPPSAPQHSTSETLYGFRENHKACMMFPQGGAEQMAYNGASTSTSSSNGNLCVEDLMDMMNSETANPMFQNLLLGSPIEQSKSYLQRNTEENVMEKYVVSSTSSTTSSSFPLTQHTSLSDSLSYDYLNTTDSMGYQPDRSKYVIPGCPKYLCDLGLALRYNTWSETYENEELGKNTIIHSESDNQHCPSSVLNRCPSDGSLSQSGCFSNGSYELKKKDYSLLNECGSSDSLSSETGKEDEGSSSIYQKRKNRKKTHLRRRKSDNEKSSQGERMPCHTEVSSSICSLLDGREVSVTRDSPSLSNMASEGCDATFPEASQFSTRKSPVLYSDTLCQVESHTASSNDERVGTREPFDCPFSSCSSSLTNVPILEKESDCDEMKCFSLSSYNFYTKCENSRTLKDHGDGTKLNGTLENCFSNTIPGLHPNLGSYECSSQHSLFDGQLNPSGGVLMQSSGK